MVALRGALPDGVIADGIMPLLCATPNLDLPAADPYGGMGYFGTVSVVRMASGLMKRSRRNACGRGVAGHTGVSSAAVPSAKIRDHAVERRASAQGRSFSAWLDQVMVFFSISKSILAGTQFAHPEFTRNAWAWPLASLLIHQNVHTFHTIGGEAGRGCRRLFRIKNRQPCRLGRGGRAAATPPRIACRNRAHNTLSFPPARTSDSYTGLLALAPLPRLSVTAMITAR